MSIKKFPMRLSRGLFPSASSCRLQAIAGSATKQLSSKQISANITTTAIRMTHDDIKFNDYYFGKRLNTLPTPLKPQYNGEWPKITLFGDSITRYSTETQFGCWAPMVAHKVLDFFDVDVRGFPGYNSRQGLELTSKLFPKSYLDKVELFVEFFGHNDSWEHASPLSVPVDEFESNLLNIIKYLNEAGISNQKIILITPAWYDDIVTQKMSEFSGWNKIGKRIEFADKYAEAKLRVSKKLNITCLDYFTLTKDYQPLSELFYDGIHLSNKGAKLLFDNLWPLIAKKIQENFGKPIEHLYHVTPCENLESVQKVIDFSKICQ